MSASDPKTKPAMAMPRDEWAQTEVHKHSTYACGKCGEVFENPDEFYDHLDEVHPDE